MDFTTEDVQHLADLSKLYITEEELEKYRDDICDILNHIDVLRDVDIEGDFEFSDTHTNIASDDVPDNKSDEETRTTFLGYAPEHGDEYIEAISPMKD